MSIRRPFRQLSGETFRLVVLYADRHGRRILFP
jgi:hypothetical protein